MAHVNVSLPDELKAFVDQQVTTQGYGSAGEYVRDLIRRQRDVEQLRQALLDGVNSGPPRQVDEAWFSEYQLVEALPEELMSSLPSIEQIERELGGEV